MKRKEKPVFAPGSYVYLKETTNLIDADGGVLADIKLKHPNLYIKGIVLDDKGVRKVFIVDMELERKEFRCERGEFGDVFPFESEITLTPEVEPVIRAVDISDNMSELEIDVNKLGLTVRRGKIVDKYSNKPIKGARVVIRNLETGELFTAMTDENGNYSLALPPGGRYSVSIQADGYMFTSTYLNLTSQKTYNELIEDIKLAPIKKGEKIVLRNIFFDFNSAELKEESIYELKRLLRLMKENPNMVVEVAGHTDELGSEEYNLELSQRRADAVKEWLCEHGIEPERIKAIGYGEKYPLVKGRDEASRALNRRVEFKILKY